jgi:hypothetical protein
MAYRKIPKKFDMAEVAAELKNILLYSERFSNTGVVGRIAKELGCAPRTVYAYMDDDGINMSLDFLHAAAIATDGDPEVCRFLEPSGFCLQKCDNSLAPDKDTVAEECHDDHVRLTRYHEILLDQSAEDVEVEKAMDKAIRELKESFILRKNKHAVGGDR